MELNRRLVALREARGWSQGELARQSGVSRSYLNELEKGITVRVGGPIAQKLALALGISTDELLTGKQLPRPNGDADPFRDLAAHPQVRPLPALPPEIDQRIPASESWPVESEAGDYWPLVSIRVRGDCMAPAIEDGDCVWVDRRRRDEVGKVIVFYSHGEWTLKRLRRRNGRWLLVPDNPEYAPLEIDPQQARILGVVVNVVKPEP